MFRSIVMSVVWGALLAYAAAPAQAVTVGIVHSFNAGPKSNDGESPAGGVIMVGTTLYGTTSRGGLNNNGTVFRITSDGKERVIRNFLGGDDGSAPLAGLIDVGGNLYGTTELGGKRPGSGNGAVFGITKTGSPVMFYPFAGGSDGAGPLGSLVDVAGTLYGTTRVGGNVSDEGYGTVFRITTAGSETPIHAFRYNHDGAFPYSGLAHIGAKLFGTTVAGGANGYGTVFQISTDGEEKLLYAFAGGKDAAGPMGSLIDVGGILYGTAHVGGSYGYGSGGHGFGAVFSVTQTGVEKVVYSFEGGKDGANPFGSLLAIGSTLYGTTNARGGPYDAGTVFSVTPDGSEHVLYSFTGRPDGANPSGNLIYADGALYGTTVGGGASGAGTVFKITNFQ